MTTNTALNIEYIDSSWEPILTFGGKNVGLVYGLQSARYIKLGKIIDFSINISLVNKGTSVGDMSITLPRRARALVNYTCTVTSSNISYGTNSALKGYIVGGEDALSILVVSSNAAKAKAKNTIFNNDSSLEITGRYFAS